MEETDAERELDLDQMWVKAQVEFQRIFPGRDPTYLPVLRIEDVNGIINPKRRRMRSRRKVQGSQGRVEQNIKMHP